MPRIDDSVPDDETPDPAWRAKDKRHYVTTPPEITDFIFESVNHLIQEHFGQDMDEPNVTILDPFVGKAEMLRRAPTTKAKLQGVEIIKSRAEAAQKVMGPRAKIIWADTLEALRPDTDLDELYRKQQEEDKQ